MTEKCTHVENSHYYAPVFCKCSSVYKYEYVHTKLSHKEDPKQSKSKINTQAIDHTDQVHIV